VRSFRGVRLRLGKRRFPTADMTPIDEALGCFWWVFYGLISGLGPRASID